MAAVGHGGIVSRLVRGAMVVPPAAVGLAWWSTILTEVLVWHIEVASTARHSGGGGVSHLAQCCLFSVDWDVGVRRYRRKSCTTRVDASGDIVCGRRCGVSASRSLSLGLLSPGESLRSDLDRR